METNKKHPALDLLSDDDIIELICWRLECRGKMDASRSIRTSYYGLGSDKVHLEEPGQVLRAEPLTARPPESRGSEPSFSDDWIVNAELRALSAGLQEGYFDDVHWDSDSERD